MSSSSTAPTTEEGSETDTEIGTGTGTGTGTGGSPCSSWTSGTTKLTTPPLLPGGNSTGLAVIEVHEGPAEVDDDEFVEEAWEDGVSSAATSITSSIYAHTYENGRRYHKYKHGRYPVPNDDIEQNREDMKHAMMMELTDGKLFYSPIGDYPQKILDIGTGTGIWAIEVGDRYPSAQVLGIDLSPIQPLWVPPNVKFVIDDIEDTWLNGDAWDLVHLRSMSPILKDAGKLCQQAFAHLRPGGWMEWQEQHCAFQCDDGTLCAATDGAAGFYALAHAAFAKLGFDAHLAAHLRAPLEAAGFRDVRCVVKKVPVGPWARDPTLRLAGLYLRTIIREFVPVCAARPLAVLGLGAAEREAWRAKAVRALDDMSVHRYWNVYFWYGQKPFEAASPS
ncbi:S-adenosyl-L-methionine-dependent methyltransferase [Xylariaceae sp. FL0662B]|nr:S-adenosyl-L-methionine-dependent methyltransferase [Xylariaceae sp. FL0662B]